MAQPPSAGAQLAGFRACITADVHSPQPGHGLVAAHQHPAAGEQGKPSKARMKKRKQVVLPPLEYVSMLLEQELQGLHGAKQQHQQHQQRRRRRQLCLPQQNQHQPKIQHPSAPEQPEQQQHWPDLDDGQLQKRQKQQQQQNAPPTALDLQLLPRNRSDLSNNRVEASPGRDRSQEQQQPQQQQQQPQPGSDAGEQVQQAPGQPQPQPQPQPHQQPQQQAQRHQQQQQPQPDQAAHLLLQQQPDEADPFALPGPLPDLSAEQQLPPPLPDLRGKALVGQLPLAIQLRQQYFTQRLINCQRSLDHKLLQGQLLLHQLLEDQQLQNQLIAELQQRCSRFEKREHKLKAKLLLQRQRQQQQQQPAAAAPAAAAAAAPDPAAANAAAAAAAAATTPGGGSSRSCALVQAGPAAAAAAGASGGEAPAPGVAAATRAAHLAALAEEKALLEGCFNRVGAFVVGRLERDCRWAALATGQKQRLLEQLEQRVISRLDGPLGLLEQLFAEPALLPPGASDGTGRSGSGAGAGASRSGRSGGSGGAAVEQPLLLQRLFDDHHQASQHQQQQQPAAKQHGQPQQRAPPPMVPCAMLGSRAVAAAAAAGPQAQLPAAAGLPGPAEAPGVVRSRSPAPPLAATAGGMAGPVAVGSVPVGPTAADDDEDDEDDEDVAAAEDFLSVGEEGVGFAGAGTAAAGAGAGVAGRHASAAGGDGSPVNFPAASAAALEDELLHGVFSSGMLAGTSSCALELLPGLELPRPAASSGGCARGVGASSSSCLVAADRGAMLEFLLCANATCSTPVSGAQGQRQQGPLGSKRGAVAAGGGDDDAAGHMDEAAAGGALLTAAEAAKRLRLSSLEVPDAGMAMTLSDLFP